MTGRFCGEPAGNVAWGENLNREEEGVSGGVQTHLLILFGNKAGIHTPYRFGLRILSAEI